MPHDKNTLLIVLLFRELDELVHERMSIRVCTDMHLHWFTEANCCDVAHAHVSRVHAHRADVKYPKKL